MAEEKKPPEPTTCTMVASAKPAEAEDAPLPDAAGREEILGFADRKVLAVEVPEWGRTVYVRSLSAAESDAFEASVTPRGPKGPRNYRNLRARYAALALSTPDGERVFTDADAAALGEKSAAALARIFDAGTSFNGMSEEDVKELEGNSGGDPTGSSPSA